MQNSHKKVGVIGYPVSHSLSPRIHNYWLKKYNINATYSGIEVKPEGLEKFLRSLAQENYVGVNITIPHKETAFRLMDEHQGQFTHTIGAINTVIVDGEKLIGANTDDYGFFENLKGKLPVTNRKVLVLGAGGAARAICPVLLHGGYEVTLVNRTRERAESLARHLNDIKVRVMAWEELEQVMGNVFLLVNTTSLGMKDQPELELSLKRLPESALVTDIVYNPVNTKLLQQARARGNPTVDGLGMLLFQAQMAFNLWFDVLPEITPELRNYVLEAFA